MNVHEAGRDIAAMSVDDARPGGGSVKETLALNCGNAIALDHEFIAKEQTVGLDNDSVADNVHRRAS